MRAARIERRYARALRSLAVGAFTLGAREFLDRIPNPSLGKPFERGDLRRLIDRQLTRSA